MTVDQGNELSQYIVETTSPESKLTLWLWIEDLITAAVAEMQERCAKVADDEAASCTHDPADFCEMFGCQSIRGIAAAIRKVKP